MVLGVDLELVPGLAASLELVDSVGVDIDPLLVVPIPLLVEVVKEDKIKELRPEVMLVELLYEELLLELEGTPVVVDADELVLIVEDFSSPVVVYLVLDRFVESPKLVDVEPVGDPRDVVDIGVLSEEAETEEELELREGVAGRDVGDD
ncbi:unnamed protein product [Clonostachys chloroleuca]|uniref:Uncharacterized protein n=1 Tax=Clonostachys chloroleuca TaxID=1926264 RepID=A0AA35LXS0_9HYPO|nr:unnamed protein product [Clonostachys chloroleuca]